MNSSVTMTMPARSSLTAVPGIIMSAASSTELNTKLSLSHLSSPISTWQSNRWESLEAVEGDPCDSPPSSRWSPAGSSCLHPQDWELLSQTWISPNSIQHRTSAMDWTGRVVFVLKYHWTTKEVMEDTWKGFDLTRSLPLKEYHHFWYQGFWTLYCGR